MTFDRSQYLNLAREIIGQPTSPANLEAKRRSAISRAYYATFISARNYLPETEGLSIPNYQNSCQAIEAGNFYVVK